MAVAKPIFTRVLDVPEVFGISKSTLYRWKRKGQIQIYKRAGTAFVKNEEMTRYIETGEVAA